MQSQIGGRRCALLFLYVVAASSAVYLFAHQDAITNPYTINDDVRQQIYWMQQWQDPDLFRDDLLTRYARNYVPWGVQAIYAVGARFMNPIQFSKVVAGILYVATALFLFGLGFRFRDELAAVFVVVAYCFSPFFLDKISGGLSQGFGVPLLAAYLYYLSKDRVFAARVVILLESLLNPYIFLLCLVTHGLYFVWQHRKDLTALVLGSEGPRWTVDSAVRHMARYLPVAAGIGLVAAKYLLFNPKEFGALVTWTDMAGHIEYTTAGRYEIIPGAYLLLELIRPGIVNLPFKEWGLTAGLVCLGLFATVVACAFRNWRKFIDPSSGFRVFFFLLPASLILYGLAWVFLFRLFLPERYVEFSLNILYVVGLGVSMRIAFGMLISDRMTFPVVTSLIVLMGALKLYHVGIFDYSGGSQLYKFTRTTPKESVFAGNPRLMDNLVTFGARNAFVTYELSHTWYKSYWDTISRRTSELFEAYYSDSPEQVRDFCCRNGIDFLVVRETDFSPGALQAHHIHFEPFDARIRTLIAQHSSFALLDEKEFPPVYRTNGIRVVRGCADRP